MAPPCWSTPDPSVHAATSQNPNTPHPLAGFRLVAGVDWVQAVVKLRKPTQHRHVRTRLQAAGLVAGRVEHIDAPHDRPTRVVAVRIQDPGTPDAFMAAFQHVAPPGNGPILESDVQITGVEIALDAHPKTQVEQPRITDAALYLFRHLARPPVGTPRITSPGHFRAAAALKGDTRRALADGWTINMGEQGADYVARCYVKRADSIPGHAYAPLPQDQHCARLELRLQGQCLPFATVAQWRALRFEKLARSFAMVTDPTPRNSMAALLQDQMVKINAPLGKPLDPAKHTQHRRVSRRGVRRDSALNQRVADALRALTKRTAFAEIHEISCASEQRATEENPPNGDAGAKYLNTKGNAQARETSPTPHSHTVGTRCHAHPAARHCPTWATRPPHHHRTLHGIPTEPRAPPLGRRRTPTLARFTDTTRP